MAGFVGADVAELRAFAKLVDTASRQLDDTAIGLTATLTGTPWLGPDGSEFTSRWNSQHKPVLTRASGSLQGLVAILVKNADDQQATSSDAGGGAGGAHGSGGERAGGHSGELGGKSVDDLSDMSADKLRDLAEKYSKDPDAAHAWWESLTPTEQARLIKDAPELVGGLDGVPALDRVDANANIAGDQIDANDARIKEIERQLEDPWRYALSSISGANDTQALRDELKDLKSENKYLQEAVDGDVQLYTYDKDADRIVEMIGNPETATQQLTWIPGTATTMESFYGHGVQGLSETLAKQVPGTVAFVMKDGTYPQWNLSHPPSDTSLARDLGETQAQFQAGLAASGFDSMPNTAVGHSAGLAILTASETAGAHYSNVVSLSGIGMAEGWTPDKGTGYYDYTSEGDAILAARGVSGILPTGIDFDGSILNPSITITGERAGFPLTPSAENGFSVLDSGIGLTLNPFDPLPLQSIDNHSEIASKDTSQEVRDGIMDLLGGVRPAGS
ncbi:hypothetical protein C5E11_11605 [Clavibacter michiganensis]|nr:hypothetical protein [Clavibacter michiganensis]PPF62189.1 hypothetical protein C5E11_11605 [Clavibacter michiganensis]